MKTRNAIRPAIVGPILSIAVGVVLLAYMVVVEDEPGALPLALVVGGLAWLFLARRRGRSHHG